jgi:sirohydrochlorin ferrochelatase
MLPPDTIPLLVDNGSLKPGATFSLRKIAAALTDEVGSMVEPVSLLHSHKLDPAKLDGIPAQTFERFVRARMAEGARNFMVLPLFFGPSAAFTEFVPKWTQSIADDLEAPDLNVHVAPCLIDVTEGDTAMAQVLADLAEKAIADHGLANPAIALVDHGTPQRPVNAVRDHLAHQLKSILGGKYWHISPASMERREGDEFAFNEPLLENLLGAEGYDRDVVLSMLFISPGRHAGPGGDIAQICDAAEKEHAGLRTVMSDLVATHPGLVKILARRFREGMAGKRLA